MALLALCTGAHFKENFAGLRAYGLSLLIGLWGAQFVSVFPTILMFFLVAAWYYPTSLMVIVAAFALLICTLSISSSIGLVHGALVMSNENFAPLFGYMRMGWVFISCFYYPLNILMFNIGQQVFDFRFLAFLNPVFHTTDLIRQLWMGGLDLSVAFSSNPGLVLGAGWQEIMVPLLFVVACAVCFPLLSVKIFNRLWTKMGIQGY